MLLQSCSSQYDLHRLLQLLADVEKLKSNGEIRQSVAALTDLRAGAEATAWCLGAGPDFRKLSQLSRLLQGSEVGLPPRLLRCTSPSAQQEEFQVVVDALQATGRYSQARQVALLAGLSVHHLLLSQVCSTFKSRVFYTFNSDILVMFWFMIGE